MKSAGGFGPPYVPLVFPAYSDGIVEAQKQDGEMFGFERAREFSTQPGAAIVAAAQQFGQHGDMTVVAIERGALFAGASQVTLRLAASLAVSWVIPP